MYEPILKRKDSATKMMERVDRYHEAITYAEANMPEEAAAVLADMKKKPSMILVLGRGYGFSDNLKDYSVGLAQRLGYEILAVNTKYIPDDFLPLVSGYRDTLRKDFTSKSQDAAEEFRIKCEAADIPFFHSIEFGESMKVVKKLHRVFGQLEYVVTEPDDDMDASTGVSRAIPVFSLATG